MLRWFVTAVVMSVLGLSARMVTGQEMADLILRGGKIVTMDNDLPVAEAIAVRGDRIVAVGSDAEVGPLAGAATQLVDLEGRLVTPGFIEGHGHFISLGNAQRILDLTTAGSWDDVVQLVAEAAANAPAGQWIVGRGWHQGKWRNRPAEHVQGYPTHTAISRLTPDHPVMLTHRAGHMLFANALAMQLAGVDADTRDPAGGELLRDEAAQPTGVFRENAMSIVRRAYQRTVAPRTAEESYRDTVESIRLATAECLRHGVTSFHDAVSSFSEVDLFREIAEEGQLKVRLWVMLDEGNAALERFMADYRTIGAAQDHLTVRGIKRLVDCALGTHGAWLLEPYDDLPGSLGHNTTSLASLERTAELALRHDYQLCVHAIGDRANHEVLNLFEKAFESQAKSHRWRIEHAQHLQPADLPRFRELGVIASMQGIHCTSDAPFVIARLGQRRAAAGAYAWRSLLDAGAVVINGSDVPVEPIDPIAGFHASVTRALPNGVRFFPEQRMTRQEALRSYTRDAAYGAFEEERKGTLTPGKLADLVVLSHDILTVPEDEILDARVDLTIVGGEVVHRRESPAAPSLR